MLDTTTMTLRVPASAEDTVIDLRTLLHDHAAFDLLLRDRGVRLRVKQGKFMGVTKEESKYKAQVKRGRRAEAAGTHDTAWEAAFAVSKEMLPSARDGDVNRAEAEEVDDDVVCTGERTREQRDAEGRANAIELEG